MPKISDLRFSDHLYLHFQNVQVLHFLLPKLSLQLLFRAIKYQINTSEKYEKRKLRRGGILINFNFFLPKSSESDEDPFSYLLKIHSPATRESRTFPPSLHPIWQLKNVDFPLSARAGVGDGVERNAVGRRAGGNACLWADEAEEKLINMNLATK